MNGYAKITAAIILYSASNGDTKYIYYPNNYIAMKTMKADVNYKASKLNEKNWNQYVYSQRSITTWFVQSFLM